MPPNGAESDNDASDKASIGSKLAMTTNDTPRPARRLADPSHGEMVAMKGDQTTIWRHFQTHETGVFDRSRPRLDALVAEVLAHCRRTRGNVVVNVGPGNGYLEDRCRDAGLDITSIDPDEETVRLMQARGHRAQAAYLDALPFAEGSVHCLVASEVLEHVPEAAFAASLAEVRRVLAPGGLFVGTVPDDERLEDNVVICPRCGDRFHRWGHQQSFTAQTLRRHLEHVGRVERLRVQSFIDWSRRSPIGLAKTLLRGLLGTIGLSIASPSLRFTVRR